MPPTPWYKNYVTWKLQALVDFYTQTSLQDVLLDTRKHIGKIVDTLVVLRVQNKFVSEVIIMYELLTHFFYFYHYLAVSLEHFCALG